jgi:hydrogenase maturation protein HypF
MRLEALAEGAGGLDFAVADGVIDPAPIWGAVRRALSDGVPRSVLAWRFHAGLAAAFATLAKGLVQRGEAQAVALSGGCFQNALLHDLTISALGDVPVLTHRITPANDGGLALGQAVVAAARGAERL